MYWYELYSTKLSSFESCLSSVNHHSCIQKLQKQRSCSSWFKVSCITVVYSRRDLICICMWATQAVAVKQLCDWLWHSSFNSKPLVTNIRALVTFPTNSQTLMCCRRSCRVFFPKVKCIFENRCISCAFAVASLLWFYNNGKTVLCGGNVSARVVSWLTESSLSGPQWEIQLPSVAVTCGSMWSFRRSVQ